MRSTGCAANLAPTSSRSRTGSRRSAAPARAESPSSCFGSTRPGTSPSAMPARISPSRTSAAPARAGTCTPPSRRPARPSASSSRRPTASAISPSAGRSSGRSDRVARRRLARDRARLRHPLCARIAYADGLDLAKTPGDLGRPGLRDLPAHRLRLSRNAAGRTDAGGRTRTGSRSRPSPSSRLGRDGLPLERGRSQPARSAAAS